MPEKTRSSPILSRAFSAVAQWIDSDYTPDGPEKMRQEPDRVDWMRCIPFLILHLGCFGALWVGVSPIAVTLGSGRSGFLVQPANRSMALAAARESLNETSFIRRREGWALNQSYWESIRVPQGF